MISFYMILRQVWEQGRFDTFLCAFFDFSKCKSDVTNKIFFFIL